MKLVAFDTSTEACSVAVQIDGEVLSDHRIVQREHAALLLPMLSELLAKFGVSPQHIDGVVFGQGPGSFTGLRIAAAAAQGLALAADCGVHGVSALQAMACGCARQRELKRGGAGQSGNKTLNASVDRYIMSAVDARMDQIYANTYRDTSASTDLTLNSTVPDTLESNTLANALSETLMPNTAGSIMAMAEEVVVDPDCYVWPEALTAQPQMSRELLLCGSGAERYEKVLQDALKAHGQLTVEVIPDVYPHALDLLSLTDTNNPSIWKSGAEAQPVYLRNKVALTEAERKNSTSSGI